MKCKQHGKDGIGTCSWCGKILCKQCVGKSDGNKKYCDQCSAALALQLKKKLEPAKPAEEKPKKKFVLDIY
mgnify:CR=1 FL=1